MPRSTKAISLVAGCTLAVGAAFAAPAGASPPPSPALTGVPSANTRSAGYAPASVLSPELEQVVVARGSNRLENPSALTSYYGYDNDVLNLAGQPQMLPVPANPIEAHKTEPDKNTYLVFPDGLAAPTPTTTTARTSSSRATRRSRRRQLRQPRQPRRRRGAPDHAAGDPGRLRQLAGDDRRHHLGPVGQAPAADDGEPWRSDLRGNSGLPVPVLDVSGALGRGGYEGIQDDSDGNLWICEDIGGSSKPGTKAKQPNSYILRYVPSHPGDLVHGRLQPCRC